MTKADLNGKTIAELVELHNTKAAKPVKKFKDKKTAVARTAQVLGLTTGSAGKKKANKEFHRFDFPVASDGIASVRPKSLRGQAVALLEKGATFQEVQKLVEKYDRSRNLKSGVLRRLTAHLQRRTYELIYLLHAHIGYGLKTDDKGVIKLMSR